MALISVLIMSVVMLIILVQSSLGTYLDSANSFDESIKEQSYAIAYSCLDHALLRITQGDINDTTSTSSSQTKYSGNEDYMVGDNLCTIGQLESTIIDGQSAIAIPATATVQNSTTTLILSVDQSTLKTLALQEL